MSELKMMFFKQMDYNFVVYKTSSAPHICILEIETRSCAML